MLKAVRLASSSAAFLCGTGVPYVAEGLLQEQQTRFFAGLVFTVIGLVLANVAHLLRLRARAARIASCPSCDRPLVPTSQRYYCAPCDIVCDAAVKWSHPHE